MKKDHDRGNKGGGRRKTETTYEFLSVKFDNCKKSAKELVSFEWKDQEPT